MAISNDDLKRLVELFPGRIFKREELIDKVLDFDFEGDARAIDQHVKNLRQKIETDSKNPVYIGTVFGVGYTFTGGDHG